MIAWLALGFALAAWLLLAAVAVTVWGLVRKVQPVLRLLGGAGEAASAAPAPGDFVEAVEQKMREGGGLP